MKTNPAINSIRQHLRELDEYISYLEEENDNLREVIKILTDDGGNNYSKEN